MCLIFLKAGPPTPPSGYVTEVTMANFFESIKGLFRNKNLLILVVVFGLVQGSFNTFGTLVSYLADAYGYNSVDSSIFGAMFVVGGIFGSAVIGVYVAKTHQYKRAEFLICFFATIFNLMAIYIMPLTNVVASSVLFFFVGFSMVPIISVSFDFGVELTYPIGESMSTGVLMNGS